MECQIWNISVKPSSFQFKTAKCITAQREKSHQGRQLQQVSIQTAFCSLYQLTWTTQAH